MMKNKFKTTITIFVFILLLSACSVKDLERKTNCEKNPDIPIDMEEYKEAEGMLPPLIKYNDKFYMLDPRDLSTKKPILELPEEDNYREVGEVECLIHQLAADESLKNKKNFTGRTLELGTKIFACEKDPDHIYIENVNYEKYKDNPKASKYFCLERIELE